jgi:hypothetical protein
MRPVGEIRKYRQTTICREKFLTAMTEGCHRTNGMDTGKQDPCTIIVAPAIGQRYHPSVNAFPTRPDVTMQS